MPTVGQHFQHETPSPIRKACAALVSNTRVGLEYEWEGVNVHTPDPTGWRSIPDGSLRDNGIELVLRGPTGGNKLLERLDNLTSWIRDGGYTPVCSERTSFHVHIDVRDMEWEQLWRMILLYVITEPYLFTLCGGNHRSSNIYCMSVENGQRQLAYIKDLCDPAGSHHLGRQLPKYASLNLQALQTFGSLEFRGHEGTADMGRSLLWINHLLALKEWAVNAPVDTVNIPSHMSALGPRDFLLEVFGDLYTGGSDTVEDEVYRGVWTCEDIIYYDRMRGAHRSAEVVEQRASGGNSLLTAFNIDLSRGSVEFRDDDDSAPRGVGSGPARYGVTPSASPVIHGERPTDFRGTNMSYLRVKLAPGLGSAISSRVEDLRVREDDTISANQAVRAIREFFGEGTNVSKNTQGFGRLGTIYDRRVPLAGTIEYTRAQGTTPSDFF